MPKNRLRIAIFSTDDSVWDLPTLIDTIPELATNHEIVGIYLFPDRLGKMTGLARYLWYLRVFGLWNFLIMGLYTIKAEIKLRARPVHSWKQLADKYQLQLLSANTPNSKAVVAWTKENKIDIILIMVNHILKEEIINSPTIGIINKHSAILPSCKGIFPYFWAKLTNAPTGITFHQVDVGIDTGRILLQVPYPQKEENISMLRFYMDVFELYPPLVSLAIDRLIANKSVSPPANVESNYFSLPNKSDYKAFRQKSFSICQLSDLFYQPSVDIDAILSRLKNGS